MKPQPQFGAALSGFLIKQRTLICGSARPANGDVQRTVQQMPDHTLGISSSIQFQLMCSETPMTSHPVLEWRGWGWQVEECVKYSCCFSVLDDVEFAMTETRRSHPGDDWVID